MSKAPWWDARSSGTFFDPSVYRAGDLSEEGHLLDTAHSIHERTSREIDGILKLVEPRDGARILDCPCGEGRHTVTLAERRYDTVGIDLDPHAIAVARKKLDTGLTRAFASFQEGSMNAIPLPDESVDAVLNMFFSFGFFDTDAKNQKTMNEFSRVLKPGGKLLIETDVNPDLIEAGQYGDRKIRTLSDGKKLRVLEKFDHARGRLNGSWEILDANMQRLEKRDYSVRIYSHGELMDMAKKAGFRTCEVMSFPNPEDNVSTSPEIAYLAIK